MMASFTTFSRETFATFRADDRPGPVHMLNLIRLHAEARYPDGRETTGAGAYACYGRISAPVLARLGGRIVWRGVPASGRSARRLISDARFGQPPNV